MKNAHDIIRGPVLTEKSYDQIPLKKYSFEVAIDANKVEIKKAIEEIFDVQVDSVNKAVVTLKESSKPIEFFESMVR